MISPLPRLILASASPRRHELLRLLDVPFEVIPSTVEEAMPDAGSPCEVARTLAEQKAADVAAQYPDALVLGADTVVALGETLLGKPRDADDARRMLGLLSGRTHQVITGVALVGAGRMTSDAVATSVTFRTMTPREIDAYVATDEPMDKAGAYAVQGHAAALITGIHGDWANVVGLPLCRLTLLLRERGLVVLGEPA